MNNECMPARQARSVTLPPEILTVFLYPQRAKPLTKARRGPGRVSEAWSTSRQVNPVGLTLIRAAPWLHRQAPLRREPAGKSELRIAKERLYPTPRLRQCQPSKRSSPGKGGHVSPDSTALAPPLSTSFCPCQLRVTASEDTPPRRR